MKWDHIGLMILYLRFDPALRNQANKLDRRLPAFGFSFYISHMKYNPDNIRMANLKEEGLHIVDKRGIPFENEAERNMIWESHIMIQRFSDGLNECEFASQAQCDEIMERFLRDIGISR